MLAMSRTAVNLEALEQKEEKPRGLKIAEDVPCAFDLERYVPPKPCKTTNLQIWSRFVCRVAGHVQEQQDLIPLTSIDLTSQPDAESDYSVSTSENCSSISAAARSPKPAPLMFNIFLGGERFIKEVEFATFARWENVRTLLKGFEDEGTVVNELWDIHEQMPIWSGDWEARVYPGMKIGAMCRTRWNGEVHCSSDDTEDEVPEEMSRQADQACAGHWWFGRWRMKVEHETMGVGGAGREPSRRTVLLGTMAMAAFLGVVIVFCVL